MTGTPTTAMRLDPELKRQIYEVLKPLGFTTTRAVNIFLKAVTREQRIRFDFKTTSYIRGERGEK